MERLKGKSILIGKNPSQSNLLIAVRGMNKTGVAGNPGSVPNSVSRCMPADGVAHASIDIDHNGNMTITNLKRMNITYVNGSQVESKRIDHHSTIELGRDRYRVNTEMVLDAARKLVGHPGINGPGPGPVGGHAGGHPGMNGQAGGPVGGQISGPAPGSQAGKKVVNISHLATEYKEYHAYIKKLKDHQKMVNSMQRVPMFFTMGSGVLSSLAVALEWDVTVRYLCFGLTMLGLILSVVFFFISKNDKTPEKIEQAQEQYQDRFVCPSCGKFLGNSSYKLLKRQYGMSCPYCKCKYVE